MVGATMNLISETYHSCEGDYVFMCSPRLLNNHSREKVVFFQKKKKKKKGTR